MYKECEQPVRKDMGRVKQVTINRLMVRGLLKTENRLGKRIRLPGFLIFFKLESGNADV